MPSVQKLFVIKSILEIWIDGVNVYFLPSPSVNMFIL